MPMMKPSRSDLLLYWVAVVALGAAIAWPRIYGTEIPAPGLRTFSHSEYAVLMWLSVAGAAIWLSVPRWITRDRLLIFAGVMGCLAVMGLFTLSVLYGIVAASICNGALRITKQHRAQPGVQACNPAHDTPVV